MISCKDRKHNLSLSYSYVFYVLYIIMLTFKTYSFYFFYISLNLAITQA